jgi:hypothetical protein
VVSKHAAVVHLVDVIAGQDDDVFRRVRLHDVQVLENGVGRAAVPPALVEPLLGWQEVNELVHLALQERPAALQVPEQAVRLVLCGDTDSPDARVQTVGQREVDDAELAAEVDRRLGTAVRELHEPAAAAASQHDGEGLLGELGGVHRKCHGQGGGQRKACVTLAGTSSGRGA